MGLDVDAPGIQVGGQLEPLCDKFGDGILEGPLGGRIRRAKMEKLPHVLVVGDDDVAHGTVGENPRGGDVERDLPLEELVERLRAEVAVVDVVESDDRR